MYFYQIKIVIEGKNLDEFIDCLDSISSDFRDEKGCLDFSFYKNIEKKNAYSLFGEWRSQKAMEKHFKCKKFSVLVGAARVLGKSLEMNIGHTADKGKYKASGRKPQNCKGKIRCG